MWPGPGFSLALTAGLSVPFQDNMPVLLACDTSKPFFKAPEPPSAEDCN